MTILYIIITILSAALFASDMVLRYTENLKGFGYGEKGDDLSDDSDNDNDENQSKTLFKAKGETIPLEKFLPENITMVFVLFFVFGVSGTFYEFMGLMWFFSLPLGIMSGMLACFIAQYVIVAELDKKAGKRPPIGDAAADITGWVTEEIDGDGYGVIEFEHNALLFRAPAMSANQTPIPKQEKVIIIFEENGFYFVESIREVYGVLEEELEEE